MSLIIETGIQAINSYLSVLQNTNLTELGITCPTGTFGNMDTTCEPKSTVNGFSGNQTTAGYYATYELIISNIQNLYDFQLKLPDVQSIPQDQTTIYTSGTTTANWSNSIIIQGPVSAKEEVYTPGYDGCIVFSPKGWCSYCWNAPVIGKICVPYPCGGKCILSGWIPPVPLETIKYNKDYTLTINGVNANVTYGYYISFITPSSPVTYTYTITSSKITTPIIFYIYDITINFNSLNYRNFTLTGVTYTIIDEQVDKSLNQIYSLIKIFTPIGSFTPGEKSISAVIKIVINPSL